MSALSVQQDRRFDLQLRDATLQSKSKLARRQSRYAFNNSRTPSRCRAQQKMQRRANKLYVGRIVFGAANATDRTQKQSTRRQARCDSARAVG